MRFQSGKLVLENFIIFVIACRMLVSVLVDMVGGVGEAGQVEQEGDRHLPQEVLHLHHHQGRGRTTHSLSYFNIQTSHRSASLET